MKRIGRAVGMAYGVVVLATIVLATAIGGEELRDAIGDGIEIVDKLTGEKW